jgi:tetratricopeptide (TPR) repeat protein/energy-coupling factor transporter ATP-binding protein EcfA2
VVKQGALFNPFPGLRPFEPDEDHLFFGREKEIDELLRRLRSNRFLSVVGTSGCGKSSLVRSGLIPSLQSGFMAKAGSSWRVSMLRPGEDPIGHLAVALDAPDVIGAAEGELASTNRVLVEATLRRGTLGLIEAVRQARIPADDNVLVVVDQFEELFRFRRSRQIENSRDEAVAFVKLLLEATRQDEVPIYIVLTMRSDFIGECMQYPGLPEAVNTSQYLVPRMTRDDLRSAIAGPVAVGGGQIAPRLVLRLLNDLGDDQDQLPVLQHALMRTWDYWERHGRAGQPMDIGDYEAVGTLRHAMSLHAEEAYEETGSEPRRLITERIFKALTDTFSDPRGVRRPTSVAELAAICEVPESEVVEIVEIFRRPGRSFLMPPATVPLGPRMIVDLSHESLTRCWTRLIAWAEEERASAAFYVRLSREASWFEEGAAGLWGTPELDLGLRWKRESRATAAWARRYDDSFERAMRFLDRSEKERDRLQAERTAARRRKFRQVQWTVGVLATFLVVAVAFGQIAQKERTRAEKNLQLAREAVDETLLTAGRDPARFGVDVPQVEEFRRELLGKAKSFYLEFIKQEPEDEELLKEVAFAHFRLGHIDRMLEEPEEAAQEYRQAILRFQGLARDYPGKPEYRQALANSFNWLGETLRPSSERYLEAEQAYASALAVQTELLRGNPEKAEYRQELARSHYNRGILYASGGRSDETTPGNADSDLRQAIRLLEPLAELKARSEPSQDLARAYNNLGTLLAEDPDRLPEARELYERAIRIHEELTRRDARNREYRLELAKFCNNLSDLLRGQGQFEPAEQRNRQALNLIEELARPAPSLAIEQADGHNLRGRILESRGSREAEREYRRSLEAFARLARSDEVRRLPHFHLRFGDLLLNLAVVCRENQDADFRQLWSQALADYVALAEKTATSGSPAEAQSVLDGLTRLMPELTERDRRLFRAVYEDLQEKVPPGTGARR